MPASLKYKNAQGQVDTVPLLDQGMLLLRIEGGAIAGVLGKLVQREGAWHLENLSEAGAGIFRGGQRAPGSALAHMDLLRLGPVEVQFLESPALGPVRPPPEVLWREHQELRAEVVGLRGELDRTKEGLRQAEEALSAEQRHTRDLSAEVERLRLALREAAAAAATAQKEAQAAGARLRTQEEVLTSAQRAASESADALRRLREQERDRLGREGELARDRDQWRQAYQDKVKENDSLRAVIDALQQR